MVSRIPVAPIVMIAIGLIGLAALSYTASSTFTPFDRPSGFGMLGPGMMGRWERRGSAPNAAPLSLDQAIERARAYLTTLNNPDLVLAEVMEFSNHFYGEVEEAATGLHAFEFLMDKYSGAITPEPGPNMMWNSKYSPMAAMMGGGWFAAPAAPNTLTADRARESAQEFLDTYLPGTTVADEADAFYGYYTLHALRDGQEIGMLSVNGYTGAVWYHTWHGDFIGMRELD